MIKTIKQLTLATSMIALSLTASGCAQSQRADMAAADTTPITTSAAEAMVTATPTGPALWKVADEDTTIYLFGTVHVLPKDVEWYNQNIATALGASDKLVTEIYMAPGTEAKAQAAFMSKGILPAGESLRALLSEEQKATYEAALAKLSLPANAFDRFEPWLAAINLSMIPLLQAGYNPTAGVESVLEEKAGKTARGELETIDFQVGIFDTLPQEAQLQFMMEVASGIDQVVPNLAAMVEEWVDGDPDGLADLLNEGLTDPTLAEALLYKRNRNWAEWIDTRLDTPGTVFVAVGAGHLAGKNSVQKALETRGIVTTRVQ